MELDLILNELSLQNPAANEQTAREWMSNFIKTIRAVKIQGVKVYLRTQHDFHTALLAQDYPLRRWLNDTEVEREEQLFIKGLVTRSPFSQNTLNSDIEDIENKTSLSEFYYQGTVVMGLAVTYLLDTIAISFISNEMWNSSRLEINSLEYSSDGEEIRETLGIRHASLNIHIPDHIEWIKERIRNGIVDGDDIWYKREELFPNLEFCHHLEKQLQDIRNGQKELQPIFNKLRELQKCCENWTSGAFSIEGYALDESGESQPTLNQYGKERTFICPDGTERLFERHIKLKFCNWRIHFFPLKPGTVIIGYIGRHLSTVKYTT